MTIAIGLLTCEGIILGADSTLTVSIPNQQGGRDVAQLFNSNQKIYEIGPKAEFFHPGRQFSGGFATWGDGSFGPISWHDLVNEFYCGYEETMQSSDNVAEKFHDFAKRKWSELQASGAVPTGTCGPKAGAFVAAVAKGACRPHGSSLNLGLGQTAALPRGELLIGGDVTTVYRIINGFDPELEKDLLNSGVDPLLFKNCANKFSIASFTEHMPLRDAVDYVHFLIYSTIKMHRYKGSKALVGGAIEIAVITGDRGFRWILHKSLSDSIEATRPHFPL
ncbi:MAG: hypothetical protein WEB58_04575 [Planctomycetaceae bacterium]